jgi:hypothetical protein
MLTCCVRVCAYFVCCVVFFGCRVSAGEKAIEAFLTTHTLFTDSGHVLDLAIDLYHLPPPFTSPHQPL